MESSRHGVHCGLSVAIGGVGCPVHGVSYCLLVAIKPVWNNIKLFFILHHQSLSYVIIINVTHLCDCLFFIA